jgi:alpha-L-arabinofuranosidase
MNAIENNDIVSRMLRIGMVLVALALLFCMCASQRLVLAQVESARATITIDAAKSAGSINPLLYGQFIEFMFEGVKTGLHAELLSGRGFEESPNTLGLPYPWGRYPDDRNDDYALNFSWDASMPYASRTQPNIQKVEHSLRVDAGDGVIPRHGIFQGRVPVRSIEYAGYLWLKTADYQGRVLVALESDVLGGPVYAEAKIENIKGDWRKYEFSLRPRESDNLARFAILFEGRGRLWVDQVSLLPGDAVAGVRRDVFEKVRALRPAFIRWPGGNVAQDYHWQFGTGPRDQRPTWINLSWKNEVEPSDFGTDEFIEFCRALGARPSITVNVEGLGATAEEAAAWVEYCNGPANSKYGAMRAKNGHAEPYKVKFWEVGNEIWGNWVRGHSDAETYARNLNRYAAAMLAVDPTIKLIAVGDNDMSWNRKVLRLAGQYIDYLAIHHYYGTTEMHGDPLNLMARPLFYEQFYKDVGQLIREVAPERGIKLNINEWNTSLPEAREHSMEAALYAARLMNVFERSGDQVAMSAVSDLVNGWPGGIIQASRHGVYVTPTGLVNAMYANQLGTSRLATKVDGPTFETTREGKSVPYLDAIASRSNNGRLIYVKAVNTDQKRPLTTRINISGAAVGPLGSMQVLTANSPDAWNSFSTPDAVSVKRSTIRTTSSFVVKLPAYSISVLTMNVR